MVLTKRDTKIIKGIAILLMMAHHLFAFPERIVTGFEFQSLLQLGDISIERSIGIFGKICVSLYMFLGGYGIYKYAQSGGVLHKRIVKLYQCYWKIFFIFVPVGFLFFSNQPIYCEESALCNIFSKFNLNEFLCNLIGWKCTYNREWWFFKTYFCTMFLGYVWMEKWKERKGFLSEIFNIIVLEILIRNIFPAIRNIEIFKGLGSDVLYSNLFTISIYCIPFFMGILFAKYDEVKLSNLLKCYPKWKRKIISILGIILIVYIRNFIFGGWLDMFYVPCLILFMLELLDSNAFLYNILEFLGKYSTNIWLIHSFYCYYFYEIVKIVYGTRNALLDMVILTTLSLLSAIMVEKVYKQLNEIINYMIYLKGI